MEEEIIKCEEYGDFELNSEAREELSNNVGEEE